MRGTPRLLCVLLVLAAPLAVHASPALANWFDDPFFQISATHPACPEPAGPRTTEAEKRAQAHHRAERGTTCWLAGQCERRNAYLYDADIAQALKTRLGHRRLPASASLWVTVQGRVVFIEGCSSSRRVVRQLESRVRALPHVQQVVTAVYAGPPARVPYRLLVEP